MSTIQIVQAYSPTSRWSIHHERSEFALYDDNGHRRYAMNIHDVIHTNGNVPFRGIEYNVAENMLCPSSSSKTLDEQNGACLSFLYLRGAGAVAHFHRNPETQLIHMEHIMMDEASSGTMESNREKTAVDLKNSDCGLVIAFYKGGSLHVSDRNGHTTYSFDGKSLWMNGTIGSA